MPRLCSNLVFTLRTMLLKDLIDPLPPEFSEDLLQKINDALSESKKTILVLDDDPSGTQTVFDVPILTDLSQQAIEAALDEAPPILFLLTNSRSLIPEETQKLHQRLASILKEYDEDLIIISRSDSTLRDHFPLEIETLKEGLDLEDAPTLFIPFFEAEGRLTIDDHHYVVEGEEATPAHLTPFAEDNAFPFSHSYLPDYFAEKLGKSVETQSLSLAQLRSGNVAAELAALPPGSICIVNAVSRKDLDVLSLALHQSERRFLIRSAASFVQSLAGIPSRPPLESWQMQDLEPNPQGGLIVVGSHASKTSAQLAHLLEHAPEVLPLELHVSELLSHPEETLPPLSHKLNQAIASGQNVVLYTSRERLDTLDGSSDLALSQTVSRSLVSLVEGLTSRPSFIIAKGGITSSDIATEALGIKRAMVLGQILPGVPVWTMGNETRHPGLVYVIFPGNVGADSALTQAYQKLKD